MANPLINSGDAVLVVYSKINTIGNNNPNVHIG